MDIHEYQAKDVLAKFGVQVAQGALAYSPEQAAYRARELGGDKWVVKAQVHAGGRGKAGGVKICETENEIQTACENMFGKKLITHQTSPEGKGIYRVYVEAAVAIDREIYLGFVLDRSSQRVMVVASREGGMEIEEISEERPDSIVRSTIDPAVGLLDFQSREIAFALGLEPNLIQQMVRTLKSCYRAFTDLDATMVEINPLVITSDKRILALDAKMTFDDNALFRAIRAKKIHARAALRIGVFPMSDSREILVVLSMAQALLWRRWIRLSWRVESRRIFSISGEERHQKGWLKRSGW